MFDIGFWELGIIALVALVVIGPERLPKVARVAGHWLGRGRRFVANVKADIDKEIKADELKQILEKQMGNPLEEIIEDTRKDIYEVERTASKSLNDAKNTFEDREISGTDK